VIDNSVREIRDLVSVTDGAVRRNWTKYLDIELDVVTLQHKDRLQRRAVVHETNSP
jgi:hypothetical protein